MARKVRSYCAGGFYHVMVQGIDRQNIFLSEEYKNVYLKYLQEAKRHFSVKIIAYCIMDNHAHILLTTTERDEQISEFFHRVNGNYAQYYNRRSVRLGPVFRDRFRSEVITDEKYLYKCVAYIQNNPMKAGMVDNAEEYPYSSLSEYLNGAKIIDTYEASRLFDASPSGMRIIMQELTDTSFLDNANNNYESPSEVFSELTYKYDITQAKLKKDKALMKFIINEMRSRSKACIRELENLTGISRSTLHRIINCS